MTESISSFLADDHRRCDHLLAACEAAINAGAWVSADTATAGFRKALLHHFALEEDVLFPAVERESPAAVGPTGAMRIEHRQMRQLLDDLSASVRSRDGEAALGDLETLHLLAQQHNAKEEGILYPLADGALGATGDVLNRLKAA